jgi:hypothetical protein
MDTIQHIIVWSKEEDKEKAKKEAIAKISESIEDMVTCVALPRREDKWQKWKCGIGVVKLKLKPTFQVTEEDYEYI